MPPTMRFDDTEGSIAGLPQLATSISTESYNACVTYLGVIEKTDNGRSVAQ